MTVLWSFSIKTAVPRIFAEVDNRVSSHHEVMKHLYIRVTCCLIFTLIFQCQCSENLTFPDGFTIGAATASYQVEGAWNISGKGESVWDWYTHVHPEYITDGSNGDVACDSYHDWNEDVELLKSIGMDYYRFSLSLTRILPTGLTNYVSEEGIQYYKNLIEKLKAEGIEPVVSLYHWDHPEILEDLGGWTNEYMSQWMTEYARVVFEELGPYVKYWITINEPQTFCNNGYNATNTSIKAPGKSYGNMGQYMCVHNVLKAHAKIWHLYDEEYRATQNGSIGILSACQAWVRENDTDAEAIDRYYEFGCGWVMNPIFLGDYPEIMKTRIANKSAEEGFAYSRLPEFSEEWIEYIKGTYDFFGVNHYTSYELTLADEEPGTWSSDSGVISSVNANWTCGSSSWLYAVPQGFGNLLRMIKKKYDNPLVYVFENGFAQSEVRDIERIKYFYGYLSAMLKAIEEDGCNVAKYTVWSLLDNFEWNNGYTQRFGIVHVDFDSANRTRTEKSSAAWWREVLSTRVLQPVPEE